MKIKLIVALMLFSFALKAQKTLIQGLVTDGQNNSLVGANIYFDKLKLGTTSNDKGEFSIELLDPLPQVLNISFVGYESQEIEISSIDFLNIKLFESVSIDEVQIKGKVNTTEISLLNPLQSQKISRDELQKAACCNLSESFETNATVDVTFTDAVSGAKQIQMLGLDGVYAQITQDNLPLIRGISSVYGLSQIPGTWIESIQIIKGAGSVTNGFESFTGQINVNYITPKNADKIFWNAYVNSEGKIENNLQLAKKNGPWKSNLFISNHYHSTVVDDNNDTFLDVPHINALNVLNRWTRNFENSNVNIFARVFVEEREGGQIEKIQQPYKVNIDNQLFELSAKMGFINPDDCNKSIGSQYSIKKHNQTALYGQNNYSASQESLFLNFIRQTYIGNTDHNLKYGLSFFGDRYLQDFNQTNLDRTDLISGAYTEYSFKPNDDFVLVAGYRSDYRNKFGLNHLPRLNIFFNPIDDMVLRLSVGKSFRIANPISENLSYLASNRTIDLSSDLLPESAWNFGFNITQVFKMFDREATINFDVYRTDFINQIIVDVESQNELSFYNLNGESYSNSFQFDFIYELFDRFDIKLAHKINSVYSTFDNQKYLTPLIPKDRSLINVAYSTNHVKKWLFDATLNRIGKSRIPEHSLIKKDFSDSFVQVNSQVTKKFTKFDLYVGGENIFDYKQVLPILSSQDPSSQNFDASLIWAPVMGRLIYAGFRFKI
jgi:outer membrane cobalamin receptor